MEDDPLTLLEKAEEAVAQEDLDSATKLVAEFHKKLKANFLTTSQQPLPFSSE